MSLIVLAMLWWLSGVMFANGPYAETLIGLPAWPFAIVTWIITAVYTWRLLRGYRLERERQW